MHVNPENYLDMFRPTDDVLKQCHQVLIGDPAFHIKKMRNWCYDQNLSLVYWELQEVADISPMFDDVAAFYFIDAKDATMFSLKFK